MEEETFICRICERSYLPKTVSANNLCEFCESAIEKASSGKADQETTRTYRRYAAMLPTGARIGVSKHAKYCFENEDRLLFIVGKKKYFFDKLNLTDDGRIKKPKKRQ